MPNAQEVLEDPYSRGSAPEKIEEEYPNRVDFRKRNLDFELIDPTKLMKSYHTGSSSPDPLNSVSDSWHVHRLHRRLHRLL